MEQVDETARGTARPLGLDDALGEFPGAPEALVGESGEFRDPDDVVIAEEDRRALGGECGEPLQVAETFFRDGALRRLGRAARRAAPCVASMVGRVVEVVADR